MIKISLDVVHPGQDLVLAVRVDDKEIWRSSTHYVGMIEFDLPDEDGSHVLEITLANKQPHHTILSSDGQFLQDVVVEIKDVAFDNITLGHVFTSHAIYSHDFNGTTKTIHDKFYGIMGCNGTISLRFTTPIYLWLLENM